MRLGPPPHCAMVRSLEGELAQTIADRNEDQSYLDDTTAPSAQKIADFNSRQKLRAEEIAAIEKAIEIMSIDTVAGAGEFQDDASVSNSGRTLYWITSFGFYKHWLRVIATQQISVLWHRHVSRSQLDADTIFMMPI